MSDTKLAPRSLNAEERAIVDHQAFRYLSAWKPEYRYRTALDYCEPLILARRAIFGEPASEGKVECPNCGEDVCRELEHQFHKSFEHGERWTCKPAQPDTSTVDVGMQCLGCGDTEPTCRCEGYSPEPVAEEMPEAVSVNTWQLEELLKYADLAEVSLRTGFHPPEFLFEPADRSLRQCIDAIKEQRDQWRTHSAQPAKVRMTEELEKVLNFAAIRHKDANTDTRILWDPEYLVAVGKAIAAVRSQAAEAGIKLPKMRAFLENSEPDAYLDAAEGRK